MRPQGSEDDFEASFIKPKKTPSKRTPAKGGRKSKGKKTNGSDDEADAEATPKAKKARGRPKGAGSTKKGKGKAVDGAEGEADDDENQPETDVKADNIFFSQSLRRSLFPLVLVFLWLTATYMVFKVRINRSHDTVNGMLTFAARNPVL